MNRLWVVVALLGLCGLLGPACAPNYPNDADHQGGFEGSEHCVDCHFNGDGPVPPDDHWDGSGNVTYDHSICAYCHAPA